MKKSTIYLIPAILCLLAIVALILHSRQPKGPRAQPALATSPAATALSLRPASVGAPTAPQKPPVQSELALLKKDYERLLGEKQQLLDAVKAADRATSELAEAKAKLEETVAQLQRERQADAARFNSEGTQRLGKLQQEFAELQSKLKLTTDELAPLKAREAARLEALKNISAVATINP